MNARRVLFVVSLLAAAIGPASAQAPAEQRNPASEAQACKRCHADHVESFLESKHGQAGNVKGPDCQSCHGNADAHVAARGGKGVGGILGFDNKAVPAERKSAACLSCHQGNRHLAFWDASEHRKQDVSCSDCHSLHGKPGPGSTVALKKLNPTTAPYTRTERQLEYETCVSCHRQIRSQLTKPSHHPIVEGKVTCSNCHNPHGALSKAMVNAETIPQLCTTCHQEKRGPYVWGHPPVEENCLTCHNAHGSNHARLLAEKAPNVCQDCHDASRHPGTIYDASGGWNFTPPNTAPNTRLIARGCLNCHYFVHGSNAPAMRGKFFLR